MRTVSVLLSLLALLSPLLEAQRPSEQWRLVEELRIASIEGPAALTFVHSLVTSADGRIVYVGQSREGLVRAFDASSGQFIRGFGRKGNGPGEFQAMGQLTLKGDSLVVTDWVLLHAVFFSSAGEHLSTRRLPPAPIPGSRAVALLRTFLSDGTGMGAPRMGGLGPISPDTPPMPWVKMSADGEYIRTLGQLERANTTGAAQLPGRIIVFAQPMTRWSRLQIAPSGSSIVLVHAHASTDASARFTVTRMDVAGDTLYHRAYRYTPKPIPTAMADSIYAGFESSFEGAPPGAVRKEIRDKVLLPPMLPPVSAVVHASDGSTWLRREESMGPVAGWLVLDPAGDIQATLQTPVGLKILYVDGASVWGVVEDEMDVSYVVRYRREISRPN